MRPSFRRQRGFSLIETLISVVLFSIGVLGLVGLESLSVRSSGDAEFRAEAAYLANQIIAQMWVDRANIAGYAYNDTVSGTPACTFGGAAGNAATKDWMSEVTRDLPGATGSVNIAAAGTINTVTVRLCWPASDPKQSKHIQTTVARINYP